MLISYEIRYLAIGGGGLTYRTLMVTDTIQTTSKIVIVKWRKISLHGRLVNSKRTKARVRAVPKKIVETGFTNAWGEICGSRQQHQGSFFLSKVNFRQSAMVSLGMHFPPTIGARFAVPGSILRPEGFWLRPMVLQKCDDEFWNTCFINAWGDIFGSRQQLEGRFLFRS